MQNHKSTGMFLLRGGVHTYDFYDSMAPRISLRLLSCGRTLRYVLYIPASKDLRVMRCNLATRKGSTQGMWGAPCNCHSRVVNPAVTAAKVMSSRIAFVAFTVFIDCLPLLRSGAQSLSTPCMYTNTLPMTALHLMACILCLMRTHMRSSTNRCNSTPPVLTTRNGAAAPPTRSGAPATQ